MATTSLNSVKTSKVLIKLIIVLYLCAEFVPILITEYSDVKLIIGNFRPIRVILIIILLLKLYQGVKWSRLLNGWLSLIASIICIPVLIGIDGMDISIQVRNLNYFIIGSIISIYSFGSYILLISPYGDIYIKYYNSVKE